MISPYDLEHKSGELLHAVDRGRTAFAAAKGRSARTPSPSIVIARSVWLEKGIDRSDAI